MGTLRLLEMVRDLPKAPRLLHASSSEIFGKPDRIPQDETTAMNPMSPYGCAKAFATQLVRVWRQTFGVFAVNAIMYNHESPRRGENFLTRKVCMAAAAIKLGRQKELLIGDTTAQRDWGWAPDYVRGMWLALQHGTAEDFVLATGELHSVQDVVEIAFETVGLDWQKYIRRDERFMRPADPQQLIGNPAKARDVLKWQPTVTFHEMVKAMTEAELRSMK
jgi:GDPmannose 4,6-dehydratase